MPTCIIGSTK